MRQGTRRDTWDDKIVLGTPRLEPSNSPSHACSRDESDQTVQCDALTHCAHLYVLHEWVFCSPVHDTSTVNADSAF